MGTFLARLSPHALAPMCVVVCGLLHLLLVLLLLRRLQLAVLRRKLTGLRSHFPGFVCVVAVGGVEGFVYGTVGDLWL
jgi:hypothetical protein